MARSCVMPDLLKFAQQIATALFARGAAIPEVRESPTDGVVFTWADLNMTCYVNEPNIGTMIHIDTYVLDINYEEYSSPCVNLVVQKILEHLNFQ